MLRPGLVSITYRNSSPREIVKLCLEAGLEGIEWGGDIHVPHGDLQTARQVGQLTRDAGLEIVSYGSYYRCDGEIPFEIVLETAIELGVPLIRVWAGNGKTDENIVGDNLKKACEMAAAHSVGIATEFHGGTLTESGQSCRQMLENAAHPNLQTLWQPLRRGAGMNAKIAENLGDLREIAPHLAHVHVYEWRDVERGKTRRLSLQHSAQWPVYIEELRKIGGSRFLLLEYVPNDEIGRLKAEAMALRGFLNLESEEYQKSQ